MTEVELGTVYDLNKQLFKKMEPLSEDKKSKELANVGGWFSTHPYCNYYMLMCKEKSYYTVLHFNNCNYSKGIEELKELLSFQGEILSIHYVHGEDAYECWIKEKDTQEIKMFYLFAYDWGVVEIE